MMMLCIRDSGQLATNDDADLVMCVTCGTLYSRALVEAADMDVWESLRLTGRYEDTGKVITVSIDGERLLFHQLYKENH